MIDKDWALELARDWIASWNAADLDRILSRYADDFTLSSPLIGERMGLESGRLKGQEAIGRYWAIGLAAKPPLHVELLDVLVGVDVVAIYYSERHPAPASDRAAASERGEARVGGGGDLSGGRLILRTQ